VKGDVIMTDWVKRKNEELDKKIKSYIEKNNTNTIELPLYDFFVMLQVLEDTCDEYMGSREVEEIDFPVYEKYMELNGSIWN
jgi:hypothetical protein